MGEDRRRPSRGLTRRRPPAAPPRRPPRSRRPGSAWRTPSTRGSSGPRRRRRRCVGAAGGGREPGGTPDRLTGPRPTPPGGEGCGGGRGAASGRGARAARGAGAGRCAAAASPGAEPGAARQGAGGPRRATASDVAGRRQQRRQRGRRRRRRGRGRPGGAAGLAGEGHGGAVTGRPSLRWVDRNSLAEVETEFLEIRALFYVSVGGIQRQEGAQDGLGAVTHLVRAMFIIMGGESGCKGGGCSPLAPPVCLPWERPSSSSAGGSQRPGCTHAPSPSPMWEGGGPPQGGPKRRRDKSISGIDGRAANHNAAAGARPRARARRAAVRRGGLGARPLPPSRPRPRSPAPPTAACSAVAPACHRAGDSLSR